MLEALSKKQKIIFFTILSVMVIFIIYYIYSTLYQNDFTVSSDAENISDENLIENDLSNNLQNLEEAEKDTIIIYICGAVKESKVITLKENSRISDAIDSVGGLTKEADLTNINLAYILEDGEKIYIPKKGEETNISAFLSNQSDSYSTSSKSTTDSSSTKPTSKININKATQTELEMIPGVGPSTALKIIEHREQNGKFKSIEDIKKVSGIGDAKYEKMKNYITVK